MQDTKDEESCDLESNQTTEKPTNSGESPIPVANSSKRIEEIDQILDVSDRNLEISLFNGDGDATSGAQGLYVYKNVLNLLPKSLVSFGRSLKTLKFFSNEINLFPPEFRDLVELECLQVKVSSIGLTGLPFHKLEALKELELTKAPPRASGFPILAEISGLKCLTRLSVCHFSIRYLPPEIGCLSNLEYLDMSFNKMRSLPKEICSLKALISLKVANNKLVEVPAGLSSLQRLENLDLSRNRLTSLGLLELSSMKNLRNLHLQYNKLLSCEIPAWICCNLEGNGKDFCYDDLISSSVEMDVLESPIDEGNGKDICYGSISCDAASNPLLYHIPGSSLNGRCSVKRHVGKRWKRKHYLQQHRARQERLNHSRMWNVDQRGGIFTIKYGGEHGIRSQSLLASESIHGCSSEITSVENECEESVCEDECKNLLDAADEENMNSEKGLDLEIQNCIDSQGNCDERENDPDCSVTSPACLSSLAEDEDESSCSQASKKHLPKFKRQSERFLDNPKPRKSRRSTDDHPDMSRKYCITSFCSIEDRLPDGFYDAGRDRLFMSLGDYEQNLELQSREVILLDRERDEELDAIVLSAQAMVFRLRKLTGSKRRRELAVDDNFLVASWLALFVSDHFGGSDRSGFVEKARKDVSGSNYQKPFVCTCATGNSESRRKPLDKSPQTVEDIVLRKLCEKSLQAIKAKCNSVVVPIGSLQFGVCRHRAVLMKYLCDRMEPPVPCELIRGYLDFFPHAWNAILVKRGETLVRMIVDACRPHDIREEMDSEYLCRYIPLSRIDSPVLSLGNSSPDSCFPSMSDYEELEKAASSSLILCKLGSTEAAAKVRTMELSTASLDEIRNFEYTCIGEVRILGALRGHPCLVEVYGHKISTEWIVVSAEEPEHRVLRSMIFMEYVRGGSLKHYVDELLNGGEKHVPIHLVLYIARDVACALKEMHSKHVIHRDIKSENILIDLEQKKADGSPIVKVSDFDRAVPLRSSLHTCCISHMGIPPPDICVGTPRWMAPEVLQAMHLHESYGLEVDIWSYGCMLLELLTLQVPYAGLPDSEIHNLLQSGRRPPLTDDLEALGSSEDPSEPNSPKKLDKKDDDVERLRFLVDIYRRCTNAKPADRPTAEDLYKIMLEKTSSLISTASPG